MYNFVLCVTTSSILDEHLDANVWHDSLHPLKHVSLFILQTSTFAVTSLVKEHQQGDKTMNEIITILETRLLTPVTTDIVDCLDNVSTMVFTILLNGFDEARCSSGGKLIAMLITQSLNLEVAGFQNVLETYCFRVIEAKTSTIHVNTCRVLTCCVVGMEQSALYLNALLQSTILRVHQTERAHRCQTSIDAKSCSVLTIDRWALSTKTLRTLCPYNVTCQLWIILLITVQCTNTKLSLIKS